MKKVLVLSVLALVLVMGQVQGAIIAEDNFDSYTVGAAIKDPSVFNGGSGWTTAWLHPTWGGNPTIVSGLTGAAAMDVDSGTAKGYPYRTFDSTNVGNVVWWKAQVSGQGVSATGQRIHILTQTTSTTKGAGINYDIVYDGVSGNYTYTGYARAGNTHDAVGVSVTTAGAIWILGMVDKTAGTSSIWLNPDFGAVSQTADDVQTTAGITWGYDALFNGVSIVDELAIAQSAADLGVTFVPEPATMMLLGLGAIALRIGKKR